MRSLQEIYDSLPSINCTGRCVECCSFIGTWPVERTAMRRAGIDPPEMTEAPCRHLHPITGRCTIYENRPAVCRLYGVVEMMKCPFGCVPERWLSREEGFAILAEIDRLERGHVPTQADRAIAETRRTYENLEGRRAPRRKRRKR